MYPVAVVGTGLAAHAMVRACRHAGFEQLDLIEGTPRPQWPAFTLGANLTRVLNALGLGDALLEQAFVPDREQVRLGRSAFLVSELPLGAFYRDRYGAPHVNVDGNVLAALLRDEVDMQPPQNQANLEQTHALVIDTTPRQTETPTHCLWHACVASPPQPANVTWLGNAQTAWQCSTPTGTHVFFATEADGAPDPADWHPSLADAADAARQVDHLTPRRAAVAEHWATGSVVRLGDACYAPNPFHRESGALALEDAWVLSRMLENYEEDIHDGLAQYARYRRPRALKVQRQAARTAAALLETVPLKQRTRNLGIALRSRFLPEMAMQKVDWFYQYDCIRGFR